MQKIHKDTELKVQEIKRLTEDSYAVRLNLDGLKFDYYAGQFVMLKFDPLKETDNFKVQNNLPKTQIRAYSMSSSPLNFEYLEVTSKKTPDGFISDYMLRVLRPGDIIKVSGPYGKFFVDENEDGNLFLIGAGSGISPLMSILRYYIAKKNKGEIIMLFSNKKFSDVIWYDELVNLQKINQNFRCYLTLTQKDQTEWNGFEGRISGLMIEKCVKNLDSYKFYICGPPLMVDSTVNDLKKLGVEESRIKIEKYN